MKSQNGNRISIPPEHMRMHVCGFARNPIKTYLKINVPPSECQNALSGANINFSNEKWDFTIKHAVALKSEHFHEID